MIFLQAGDVAELAMQVELSGEAYYREVAKEAKNSETRTFFEEMADQEVAHYKTFSKLRDSVKDAPWLSDAEWEEYAKYIQATVQSAFFEGPDKALALARSVNDDREAIQMAIAFEKETLLFFYELHDIATGAAQEPIQAIIDQEKSHIRRLAGLR